MPTYEIKHLDPGSGTVVTTVLKGDRLEFDSDTASARVINDVAAAQGPKRVLVAAITGVVTAIQTDPPIGA